MKYIFYDDTRVVLVQEAAYVMAYTATSVDVVQPEGGVVTIEFGSKCKLLRDTVADCCGMLAWKGIDTTQLDDFILAEYGYEADTAVEQAPATVV